MDSISVKMISVPNAEGTGSFNLEVFTGATASTAGSLGLVPTPAIGDQAKFLAGDGTWKAPIGNLSGMTNDAGFVTNSDLTTNYYSKTQADSEFAKKSDMVKVYKTGGSKSASEFTSALLVEANEGYVFNLTSKLNITSSNDELFSDNVTEGDSYPKGTNILIIKVPGGYQETSDTTVQEGTTYYSLENEEYVEVTSLSTGDDISEETYYILTSDSYKFDPLPGKLSDYATLSMVSLSNYAAPNAASSHTAILTTDTIQQALAKLEASIKGIIAGNITVGHASLADNIPTTSGNGNIYIS